MGDIRAGLDELKLDVALFADVKYYVSGEGDPKILALLQKGGAVRSNYYSDLITHLIAGYEALESDISAAKDLYDIPAVTQDWILYSAKCRKLLPPKYFSPETDQLFSNIRACISQVSRADSKVLWAMITLQGGKCQLALDRYCTHLITGKASGVKYDTAMRFDSHHVQIVTPDWIAESCRKGTLVSETEYHPKLLIYPSPNSSTALITGFMDEDGENNPSQEEQDRTKAMLEQLKQRMPWNQPNTSVSANTAPPQSTNTNANTAVAATMMSNVGGIQQQQQQLLQQPHQQQQQQPQPQQLYSRPTPPTSLPGYMPPVATTASTPNLQNQNNWHSQNAQGNSTIPQMKPQVQQQEIPQQQINLQQQQQQQMIHHQQQMQQQNFSQQQLLNSQASPQLTSQPQPVVAQQQALNQQMNMQIPQHQLAAQQQLLSPQQKQQQLNQHQLLSQQQQQINQQQQQQQQINQQQQLGAQQQIPPQQAQLMAVQQQQQQQQMQMPPQQQIPQQPQLTPQMAIQQQQISPQQQQIVQQQHQLAQQQQVPQQQQQLTPEQRQQLHLLQQQQQQQQKIQQISQQLQQSAPQSSQQFVIRDGQLQQQTPNQQLLNPNQQSFLVQRDPQWQQQQYHLQLQRQQQQQQLGQQRPGGQWAQQPPQPPRQLIQLDAQTHQQLQQMDPQQRAQFIQKIQKQRNLMIQRQMQNRQAQQGPHIAVIRSPGKPGQPGLQWVPQPRPQMMGPQVASAPGQKPMHPGVQPPALTPINSPNQVIVQSGQAVQGPQPAQSGQAFQQGQPLTPQQLAQLHMQKQQQMARLQMQHLQQQQAQQQQAQQQQVQQQQQAQQQQQQPGPQQEPPLTPLAANSQMPPDQQLVVNAKTKTALANMLTNRLQGGAAEGSAAGQLRLMTAQHRPPPPPSQDPQLLAAYQRRTLGNITNGAAAGAPIKMQYAPAMPQPKAQFYGHNPNLKLPPDLFLLGCIFVIVEYEAHSNYASEVLDWKQVIERHGGEVEPQYCARATHVLAITQKHPIVVQALREGKRCVSADWLSDVVIKQQVLPPWNALHFPIPFSLNELPCSKQIISISGFEDDERNKVKSMLDVLGAKHTKYFSKQNNLLVCRRPDGPKYKKAREWQIGVVNAQWLTDLICGQRGALHQADAPKYQQFSLGNPFRLDYSLVPHLMAAWKMPINITQESYDKVKQVGQGPNVMRKYKKPRLEDASRNKNPHLLGLDEPVVVSNPDPPTPEKQPKILFSGINAAKHAKRIRELGGALAASWRDATHLVMASPIRTVKLLCCLSRCKFIVSQQWLVDCSTKNTFVDESSYTLGGADFEKNYKCNIEKALASPNRGSVLKGKTFYVTPSIVPSPAAFAEIVESAGGTMEKTRRSIAQIQEMNATKLNYIIITHGDDLHLLADVVRANISMFNPEIVLRAISRQHFQIDANQL